MKEIYLLSGLGADKRVFEFLDLSNYKLNYIDWIDPLDNESIEDYTSRLLKQITTPRPILIGVSFGGIVAIEIGKAIETETIISISSARTMADIPFYYRAIGLLRINHLFPTGLLKRVNTITFWFFGAKTKKEKELLKTIIKETNNKFLKWAIDKIVNWRNRTSFDNLIQIHGTADRILPINTADFKVINGGHFMIVNKADEISGILRTKLG